MVDDSRREEGMAVYGHLTEERFGDYERYQIEINSALNGGMTIIGQLTLPQNKALAYC